MNVPLVSAKSSAGSNGSPLRAKTVKRRLAVLEAAKEEFLANGYERTTVEAIIAKSGGSRNTVYQQFGGKTGLFAAVVIDALQAMRGDISAGTLWSAHSDRDLEEILFECGVYFMQAVLAPEIIALTRIMIAESVRFPDLGKSAYELVSDADTRNLARYLREEQDRGSISVGDCYAAAWQFKMLLLGGFQFRCLVDPGYSPSAQDIRASARSAVHVFLDGTRRRD